MIPILAACIWALAANVVAMFPSRRKHWPAACVLMATGAPLLVWLVLDAGIWAGLVFLAAAASILRWPLWLLWRWIRTRGQPGKGA